MQLKDAIRVDGVPDADLGPRTEFAKFTAIVELARMFEASFQLPQSQLTSERQVFLDQAIFGLLDILMTRPTYPLRDIRVRVIEAEFDPIHATASAFRQAGRDAGRKLLDVLKDPRRS